MTRPRPSRIVRFGAFTLDLRAGQLKNGEKILTLQEQPFRLLKILLERGGDVVTREELQRELWPDNTTVEFGHGINSAVKRLRDALSESAERPLYVETVGRRGYRFLAPVEWEPGTAEEGMALVREPEPALQMPVEHPRKRGLRQGVLLLALAVLFIGVVWETRRVQGLNKPATAPITSLAVLPLENLSAEKTPAYFAEGITEQLISNLGKIRALRVISRTSVLRYRASRNSVAEVARALNVDALVEGTVVLSGNRVRITAHLIRAVPESHIWTENYEGSMGDLMTLQDNVARQIAREIQVKVTPQEQAHLSTAYQIDPKAHEAYLKGKYLANARTDRGMETSIAYLQEAVRIDPHYALAYSELANAYLALAAYGLLSPNEAFPAAEQAARRAMEIDETLAEAHTALGFARSCYDRDWSTAEKELRRAIELNPSYALGHMWYGEHLENVGEIERGLAEFRQARELDPLWLVANAGLGRALRDAHRFEEGIEQCKKTLDLEPNFAHGHWCLGLNYLAAGRSREAIEELQKAKTLGEGPVVLWALGHAYGIAGRKSEAAKIISEMKQLGSHGYVSPYFLAGIYAGIGDKDRAFQMLEISYETRDYMQLKSDPFVDSLRSDARFDQLLRRMNLPL